MQRIAFIRLIEQLKDGITLKHLDLGGGLGVTYTDETPPHPSDYAAALLNKLKIIKISKLF